MAECPEEPSKHLAALYNTSFVILSGKAFFPPRLHGYPGIHFFKSPMRENGGVRAPLSVDSRKLHGGKCTMRGCWEIGRFGYEYFGLVKFEKGTYYSDSLSHPITVYIWSKGREASF